MTHNAYAHLSGAATTLVKTGAGTLHNVVVNTPIASGTVKLYDGLTASGTLIASVTLPATLLAQGPNTAEYGCQFSTGLTVVTTGSNQSVTVIFE